MKCEMLYDIKKLYEKIEENTFKTNIESNATITYKQPDVFFSKALLTRYHKLSYNSSDLIFYSLHKPTEEKDYLAPLKAKLEGNKLSELIEKEKLQSSFTDYNLRNHIEYRFKTPINMLFSSSRSYRLGFFYETSNHKEKLFTNKKFGLTFTRDLADSLFSIAFGSQADITPRKFFYSEIDRFNMLNPEKKINYDKINKSFLSLNLDYYALFDLYMSERGIFGLKSKFFLHNTTSYDLNMVFSAFLSRQVKDKLDFALKVKVRGLRGPKLTGNTLDSFKALEEFKSMNDLVQDSPNFLEFKSILNYKIDENFDLYGHMNVFDNQVPKAGIGFKYFNRQESKDHYGISMLNTYLNTSFVFKADVKIPVNENIELTSGLKKQDNYIYPYINITINANK